MRPDPSSGLAALPLPRGDPAALWAAAGTLRTAAATTAAPLPSGVMEGAWAGVAADQAMSELTLVAARTSAWADRVGRAAAIVGRYGDELDAAQRSVTALQSAWDQVAPADPTLAHLSASYTVVLADLELAAGAAAHRLRALVGEVVAADVPGHRALTLGWGDPMPSDAAVRGATLAQLDLVAGAERRADAERLADVVVSELAGAQGDPWAAGRALSLLGPYAYDPVVAQALWSRLDPASTARLLDGLTADRGPVSRDWADSQAAALLVTLGTAFAVAANPLYAHGLDPQNGARLEGWRGSWLARLASSVSVVTPRIDGGTVGGAWVQGQLLSGARRAGLSPGPQYASTVGVALVAADRDALSRRPGAVTDGSTRDVTGLGRHVVVPGGGDDPVRALAEALAGDVQAARAWLLAPLPDGDGRLVIDHAVAGRYVALGAADAAASMAAVGHLVAEAGTDPADRASVHLAAAFVAAVGTESQATAYPAPFRSSLAPALGHLGTVLATYPAAVSAILDDSAAAGRDAASLSSADRLVREGRLPGTWEIVIADRAAAAAVLGQLAFDGLGDSTAPLSPGQAPALTGVLDSIGRQLDADLVEAVRAERAGDPHAVDAAAYRLGLTVGFTLTSAGDALAGRDADIDARHTAVAVVVEWALDKVAVPGMVGKVATPLVHWAGHQAVSAALPTDAEAGQREATSQAVTAARDVASVEIRSVVSRARPWSPAQAPAVWAATSGAIRFWDDQGIPLAEGAMTTAQRRAFTDWRREVGLSVYDTVPQRVREGIDDGVREAVPR